MITKSQTEWWTGSNGNLFCDMGGFRYCVARAAKDSYEVARNGVVIHTHIPSSGAARLLAQADGRIHETYGTNSNQEESE